jgi:5-methylcytosine-specific restriction endonuclease McrA
MIMFAARNPMFAARNPRRSWAVAKVMRQHVRDNPCCAWCGGTADVQAHHIVPVAVDPELAARPDNLVSLCGSGGRECHVVVGHGGNTRRYTVNVMDVIGVKSVKPIEEAV